MRIKQSDLRTLYQEATSRGRTAACPGTDELEALASGAIDDPRRAALIDHLAGCLECAREYQIAASLSPLRSDVERMYAPAERRWMVATAASLLLAVMFAGWMLLADRRQQGKIAALQQRIDAQQRTIDASSRDRQSEQRTIAELRESLNGVSRPYAGMPIIDLDAAVSRGRSEAGSPGIPLSATLFTIILHLPQANEAAADVRITGPAGKEMWSDRAPVDRATSTLTLTLNRSLFVAGDYEVRVRRGERDSLFRFRVE
jgi:hypothetical protein